MLRHQFGDSKLHVHHSSLPGSAGICSAGSSPQMSAANSSSTSTALGATPRPAVWHGSGRQLCACPGATGTSGTRLVAGCIGHADVPLPLHPPSLG